MPDFAPQPSFTTSGTLFTGQFLNLSASSAQLTSFLNTDNQTSLVAIEVQQGNAVVTFDGSTPTVSGGYPTNGHLLYAGQTYHWSPYTAQTAKFIEASGTSTIQASRFTVITGDTSLPDTSLVKPSPVYPTAPVFSTLTVTGSSSLNAGATIGVPGITLTGTTSSHPHGGINLDATNGLMLIAPASSITSDIYLGNSSGLQAITIPAGTQNVMVWGTFTIADNTLHRTTVTLTNGAASTSPTLGSGGPAGATTPTKWVPINDNGTTRYIPCW